MNASCPQCATQFDASVSAINHAARINAPLYCGRACAGLARRKPRTEIERKAAKRVYDAQRRINLADRIKAEKAAYFKRTYDHIVAAQKRKKRMPRHVEYCRAPEYKAKKAAYDQRKKFERFGLFAEAAQILAELDQEVKARATRYEIYVANERFTRSAQQRRRELWQQIRRN
jgi:hypothetical protein